MRGGIPPSKLKKVMNMNTRVSFRVNGRIIDSTEPRTAEHHAEALVRVRNRVGFAHVPEEDQSNTPIEVSVSFDSVPLTTVTDYSDVDQLRGLDDMTAVYYNKALNEVYYELMAAVEDNQTLMKAVGDCSLGQLFLVLQEIKANIDCRNGKE